MAQSKLTITIEKGTDQKALITLHNRDVWFSHHTNEKTLITLRDVLIAAYPLTTTDKE